MTECVNDYIIGTWTMYIFFSNNRRIKMNHNSVTEMTNKIVASLKLKIISH